MATFGVLHHPVVQVGGQLYLRQDSGKTDLLFVAPGEPAVFAEGWTARLLHTQFHPLRLLELQHTGGAEATWYLDDNHRRLGGAVADLPSWASAHLKRVSADLFNEPRNPTGTAMAEAFLMLNPATRSEIAALHLPSDPTPRFLEAEQHQLGLAYGASPLRPLQHITPAVPLNAAQCTVSGLEHRGGRWWVQGSCEIRFTALAPVACYFLRVNLGATVQGMRLHAAVNGHAVGKITVAPWQTEGLCLGFWLPAAVRQAAVLMVALRGWISINGSPEPAGFSIDFITLLAGVDETARVAAAQALAPAELMAAFESIGDNCDFGTVQRHYKFEPLGLLRFASVGSVRNLIRMFDENMKLLGTPNSLGHYFAQNEYMILDKNYGLTYHTFLYADKIDAASVYQENEAKLTYLKRKLIEDFEDGLKIFVYKSYSMCRIGEILALHTALKRFGPVKLLWVSAVEPGHQSGDVEWVAHNLLHGYVEEISFADFANLQPAVWLDLCRNAYIEFARAGSTTPSG